MTRHVGENLSCLCYYMKLTKSIAKVYAKRYNTSKGSDIMSKISNVYIRLESKVRMPSRKPLVYEDLSEEDFDHEMQKAMDDFDNGRTYTSEEVEKNLEVI